MKIEDRGKLKIGEAVYMLCYGKFWWGVGKDNEYRVYKGIVRRKPKCDKSIVLVDFGTINKHLIGVQPAEIETLYKTPIEAVEAELKELWEEEKENKHRCWSLGIAAAEAEKMLEQGSLDLKESESEEEEQEDKLECE